MIIWCSSWHEIDDATRFVFSIRRAVPVASLRELELDQIAL
jgi:hypothetical protein